MQPNLGCRVRGTTPTRLAARSATRLSARIGPVRGPSWPSHIGAGVPQLWPTPGSAHARVGGRGVGAACILPWTKMVHTPKRVNAPALNHNGRVEADARTAVTPSTHPHAIYARKPAVPPPNPAPTTPSACRSPTRLAPYIPQSNRTSTQPRAIPPVNKLGMTIVGVELHGDAWQSPSW